METSGGSPRAARERAMDGLRWRRVLLAAGLIAGIAIAAVIGFAGPADWMLARAVASQGGEVLLIEEDPPRQVSRQIAAVQEELGRLRDHPWAGTYYEGDGLGANILVVLAPDSGVAATWHGCLGLYGANEGSVLTEPDGSLAFRFNLPNEGFAFPEEVVRVPWGERRYLIPPERMIDFVDAIHHGHEPRSGPHGMFLLAEGDEWKPVEGLPELPEPHAGLLRSEPLEVGVLAVETVPYGYAFYCNRRFRVTLDHGMNDGIVPGMTLQPAGEVDGWISARITSAGPLDAIGELVVYEPDCAALRHTPGLDWRWTTGAFDPVAANLALEAALARRER